MARKDIVLIGASAGGMEALQKLVSRLPADLPARFSWSGTCRRASRASSPRS